LLFDFDDYRYFDIEREIERFAEEEGIPVASLTSGFLGRDAESLWVASNDQHPNEEGHRIAADTLYPHIQAMISGLARTANPER
jgi:lysophospholipase L1-like esterase